MKRSPMKPGKGFKRPDVAELRIKQAEARLTVPVFRPRLCGGCRVKFTPARQKQVACGTDCAMLVAAAAREKNERAVTRAAKAAAKPRGQVLREAQQAFNAYIRARDDALPCISCSRHHDGQWHAGHYLTTGARPELRFDAANCHKQCAPCNLHLHGNPVPYRAELIRRRGLAEVERLEGPHAPLKLTIPDLQALRAEYRAKLKALSAKPLPSIPLVDADMEPVT